MAKDKAFRAHKKFRHTSPRPTLAASLEAVRQGKSLESHQAVEPVKTKQHIETAPTKITATTSEAAVVKTEMKRIGLIMGALLALLLALTIAESRTGWLTESVGRFF